MSLVDKLQELNVVPNFIIDGIFENKGRKYAILEIYNRESKISFYIKYLDSKSPERGFIALQQLIKHKYVGKYQELRLVK